MYNRGETCDDCECCRYDYTADCYICKLDGSRIELYYEACDEFIPMQHKYIGDE